MVNQILDTAYFQENKLKNRMRYELTSFVIMSERIELSSYQQSYMGRIDDIQTALKPFKKSEKKEINLYDHFRTN